MVAVRMAHHVDAAKEGTNANRAMATLTRLDTYEEDDGIARTLRAQVAALFQSTVNENVRRRQIDGNLKGSLPTGRRSIGIIKCPTRPRHLTQTNA